MEPLPEEPEEPICVSGDAKDDAAHQLVGNAGPCDNGRDIPCATAQEAAAPATIAAAGGSDDPPGTGSDQMGPASPASGHTKRQERGRILSKTPTARGWRPG